MIDGANAPYWFGPAKFVSTRVTAIAGLPGGLFAPSLAIGTGLGNRCPGNGRYFAGAVRAPLTAVIIIITETTSSRNLMLPMVATAFIADGVNQWICREKLYHGLARGFTMKADSPVEPAIERAADEY